MDERDKTKGREFLRSKFAKGISAENKSLYKKAWAKGDSKSKALKAKKGHKLGEREARSKKAGHYVHGHKNYGDVYEA